MTVIPDPDLMAAQPASMYAAAASYESAAHTVSSVAGATGRASGQLLAGWKGHGAAGFATRMNRLASATPDAAQALLAVATALRTLAAQISEAQGLARQAMALDEQAATVIDQAHQSNVAGVRAGAVVDEISPAQTLMDRANGISRSAWSAARAAFAAITGISPSVKTATLTSAVSSEPARQPNDHRPTVSVDQVRVVTQADGRRVYSFDGGLAIPVDMPGAHQFVEKVKAYMPRLLRGDTGNIEVPAGLSAKDLWFEAAYICATTTLGEVPRELRNVFSTATSSSITFRQVAGFSMLGATDAVGPTDLKPETAKGSDFLNNGDVPPEVVASRQIVDSNRRLGTAGGARFSGTGAFRAGTFGGEGLGSLEGRQIQVTEEGLAQVEAHLEQFGPYGPNEGMISRLESALASGEPISGADAAFYTHELTEAELMASGMPYEEAHAAALAKYGVSPFAVYAPEVIARYPDEFGPGWKAFWRMSE